MTQGMKFDEGKRDWSLLPLAQVEQIVKVLEFGAKKYAPDNWMKVQDARKRYYNAAVRHIVAWKEGESKDKETGLSHLAHAACCLLFLMHGDSVCSKEDENVQHKGCDDSLCGCRMWEDDIPH